jgi:hypothetical protein
VVVVVNGSNMPLKSTEDDIGGEELGEMGEMGVSSPGQGDVCK